VHNPDYATGHLVMGEIFRDAALPEKAKREWQEVLRLDPAHPGAYLRLGELHLSRGEMEEAISALETALLYTPDSLEAQGKLAEAREAVQQEGRGEQDGVGAASQWAPGERPAWLTGERFEELVKSVAEYGAVEAAALVNSDGLLLEGGLPAPGRAGGAASAAGQLTQNLRDLMRRLGAGRLRGASLCGERGGLRCAVLGDVTLVAALRPGVPVGAAESLLGDAVNSLRAGRSRKSGSG